ncbi:uncharacterized protein LOC124291301 [Haliotis rubra]|uniref:uncharacterized protein LOC124291301 n=1 Tax=Haliotis rubra TaxID=36100 RepID=UPI001EE4EC19|nr:uncharacterized protein LOC124291301 [Haliotis rubra]
MDPNSMSFFPVLAVVLHEARGLCQQGSLAASAVHRGKEFVADSFEFQGISSVNTLINCGRLCLARSECKSFTYNDADGTCKAFTITANNSYPLQTSSVSTMVYVEADQLPKILAGPCGNRPCQPFEACVEESSTSYRCAAIGRCRHTSAPQVPNADVVYLSGVKAEYTCSVTAPTPVSSNVQSWCIGNNIWTEPNIKCIESQCLTPPVLTNADLVNVGALEATYMCSKGYINVRATTNTIFTSSCSSDNTWTTPNYKCSDTKDCYYYNTTRGRGIYSGLVATTTSGKACLDWSNTNKADSVTQASLSPETLADVRNYCRDAGEGYWTYPWCFTEEWTPEACGIPHC